MTKSEIKNTQNKPKAHTKLSVLRSVLKAFKLAELLTMVNNMLAVFAIVYSPTLTLKLLASLVLIVGLVIFYFAMRVRIDISLFEYWDTLDIVTLDDTLANINPKHQSGRALEVRLQGSYQLFNRGLLLLFLQFCLLLVAVWLV